ncbi:hypothetical protein WAI56_19145, partial [Acinetobacter baumannii]
AKAGDALVTALMGNVSVGDAKPEQIDTTFRALCAVKGTQPSNPVGDALHQQQSVKAGDRDPAGGGDEKTYSKENAYKTI